MSDVGELHSDEFLRLSVFSKDAIFPAAVSIILCVLFGGESSPKTSSTSLPDPLPDDDSESL